MRRRYLGVGIVAAVLCGGSAGPFVSSVVSSAAPPSATGSVAAGHGSGTGGTATPLAGNDVSYPQCGVSLPASPAFGVVGVNDGVANDLNPCLAPSSSYPSYAQSELYWAVARSTGKTSEPKASVYVNTGDPGNFYDGTPIADWPTSGTTPTGTCATTTVTSKGRTYTVGQNSSACAWQYGYDKAQQDVAWLHDAADAVDAQAPPVSVPTTASSYPWWLDVETGNTWQSGTAGIAMNVAALQGMVAAMSAAGVSSVGVYSTSSQWSAIAGTTTSASGDLYGLADWVPGASNLTQAVDECSSASFTRGKVLLTQWTTTFDYDHAC